MQTLEKLRSVKPDLVHFTHGKWHLSYDTVSNQWRDPSDQPRTFCGIVIAWYAEKQSGWSGDATTLGGEAICIDCLRMSPGRLRGQ